MSEDKKLYDFFHANKAEFADTDFPEQVMKRLPKRNSLLPPIIISICLLLGILLTVWLQGGSLLFEGIQSLGISLAHAQLPPVSAIIDYLIFLLLAGSISISTFYFYDR